MTELLQYFLRITPGTALVTLTFLLVPRDRVLARIFMLIIGFVLMRDAMTPTGLWQFGVTGAAIWLRFVDSASILLALAVLSLAVSMLLLRVPELAKLVRWGEPRSWRTYGAGVLAGIIVAAPFLLSGAGVGIELRGGTNPPGLVVVILVFAMAGNFLEELIFRGFLQGHLEQHMPGARAALLSGLLFAVAHVFLASTVTAHGWPLLLFVLVEGLACAFVHRRFGLISAALVHGTVIFLLASGLF